MCRIAGLISKEKIVDFSVIEKMLVTMKRGGPDDSGIFTSERVCFGHNRLSIIDMSADGHQPMKSKDGALILTFNGEIYNYQKIRDTLKQKGLEFKSNSDTEVILKAYEYWGIECVSQFEGIFALALFDKKNDKVFLVRDYPGVKPLYYSLSDNELVFASEVKAFKALNSQVKEKADWEVLFLAFGFMPYPYTTLKDVLELAPGTVLELSLESFSVRKLEIYPNLSSAKHSGNTLEELALVKSATESALMKNLISDAPLGTFLSGGLDSSIITIFSDRQLKKLKTISVNFAEAEFDESFYQQEVVKLTKNTEHVAHQVSSKDFWRDLPEYWEALDQPTVDGVNAFFISKCAHYEGLKAVVSGIGADELFGGYASFKRIFWMRILRWIPFKWQLAKLLSYFRQSFSRLVYLDFNSPVGDYLFLRGLYSPSEIAKLTLFTETQIVVFLKSVSVNIGKNLSAGNYVSELESKLYLSNQLLRDFDTMGMWHGLEVRVPFLDIRLIHLLDKIDPNLRFRGNKYLLRNIFGSSLPPDVLNRKKKGFTFPFGIWLREDISRIDGIGLNVKGYGDVRNKFLSGKIHWSKIWVLIVRNQFKEGGKESEVSAHAAPFKIAET